MFDSNGRTSFITTAASLAKLALQQSHHRNGGRKQGGVQGSIAAAISGMN
jgi:hypothetical protein